MKWTKKTQTVHSVTECCLEHLGVSSTDEINAWFLRSRNGHYAIKDLDKAVEMLTEHKEDAIVICADYDCDGVSAAAIMYRALSEAGFPKLDIAIPDRHTQGYGLNTDMVQAIRNTYPENVTLLTVDNGIAAFDAIKMAKEYGMTVIVTDHHEDVPDEDGLFRLPEADIIIDPAAVPDSADFRFYCGAGIAYKMAVMLLGDKAKKLMPLAAIATIADVVPLREENYVFVRDGLRYINIGTAPNGEPIPDGITSLVEAYNLEVVDEQAVGFKIAPALNAPGRLLPNGAKLAVDLLLLPRFEASKKAHEIMQINEDRKAMVNDATERFNAAYEGEMSDIIIGYIPGVNPGIVGIIAGKVSEERNRPVVVLTDSMSDADLLTGSARSVDELHIKDALDHCSSLLAAYGGHAGAAGLSVSRENYAAFSEKLKAFVKNKHLTFTPPDEAFYDLEIQNKDLTATLKEIRRFAPFGEANPQPVVKVTDFDTIPYAGVYKKEIAGGGIRLSSHYGTAVGFGLAPAMQQWPKPKKLTLYGELSANHFRGKTTSQILFTDFEVKAVETETPMATTIFN